MRLAGLVPVALVASGVCSLLGFGLAAVGAVRSGFAEPRSYAAPTISTVTPDAEWEARTAVPPGPTPADSVAGAQATPEAAPAPPSPGAATPAAAAVGAVDSAVARAETLVALMNRARAAEGLGSLTSDLALAEVALARARNLLANGYFDHYAPDGESAFTELADRGIRYRLAGENLARNNYPESRTVQGAFDGLMASAGHRANLLEPRFARAGVAAVSWGKLWLYVTVFTD
ncbi:MAG: hypothetical protein IT304_12260 [Dehalococcoidia bacterium]|nr:hypothetical protein [Dehalococcoidia bacterium]